MSESLRLFALLGRSLIFDAGQHFFNDLGAVLALQFFLGAVNEAGNLRRNLLSQHSLAGSLLSSRVFLLLRDRLLRVSMLSLGGSCEGFRKIRGSDLELMIYYYSFIQIRNSHRLRSPGEPSLSDSRKLLNHQQKQLVLRFAKPSRLF